MLSEQINNYSSENMDFEFLLNRILVKDWIYLVNE
jgi:hypothetical protein